MHEAIASAVASTAAAIEIELSSGESLWANPNACIVTVRRGVDSTTRASTARHRVRGLKAYN